MASHVVVIDSAARRHQVKTTPNKSLSEVLEEACSKIGVNAVQYGLKHNNKPVDLSRSIRLSGLSSGAKLELVQTSKSAGVVSVALQLPPSEAQGVPNARLTDKFPSTTTLWLILRKFEAGVAGGAGSSRNLTAKGAPSTGSGAGRLFYQQPVIQLMGRELASFTDLQKSLAQLGFNGGSTLLRLNFKMSDLPLEEAMTQIQGYFDSIDAQAPPPQMQQPAPAEQLVAAAAAAAAEVVTTQDAPSEEPQAQTLSETPTLQPSIQTMVPESSVRQTDETPLIISGNRSVAVFAPPSAITPSAATIVHNDGDYTPTVEHAQIHQKMLQQSTQNRRLLTDAELEAKATAEQEKWASVTEVEIKVRFPDQSAVSAKFGQEDTAANLYSFARDCLDVQWQSEPFVLRNPGVRGKGETVPDDAKKSLIKHLQLKGRVLVVFGWDEHNASLQARGTKSVLKSELRSQAVQPTVRSLPDVQDDDNDKGVKVDLGKGKAADSGDGDGKKKLPKWLKGFAKK